jgi:hypothetical protein
MTNQIRYNLHHNLKMCGNVVFAKQRLIVRRAKEVSAKEMRRISRLIAVGYGVSNDMFQAPTP